LINGEHYNVYFSQIHHVRNKNDEQQALAWLKKSANHNYSLAQYELANKYERGDSVKRDLGKAEYWYLKAAKNGFLPAQNSLGAIYLSSNSAVKKNVKKGLFWLENAANSGSVVAQSLLCSGYDPADTDYSLLPADKKDYTKAFDWCLQAAKNGDSNSQFSIALYYKKGLHVKRDLVKAYVWMYLSWVNSEQPSVAKNRLKRLFIRIKGSLTDTQQTEAEILISQYLGKYRRN